MSQALAMPITTPVPEEYAKKWDASTPSKYDQYVAFTGPYMVKNDPKTGKVTGRVPGKSISIVRNPNWDKATDYRPAYLDAINIEEGNDDLATAARRALNGSNTICCDSGAPPAQVLKQAVQRYKDQIIFVPSGGTRWISFNTKVKPFDNLNVRKAIIAASNRNALRLTRGGAILGDIATGWIPPGIPGFEESGGVKQNTDLDYLAHPEGDPAVSKKYMLAAKKEDPSLPIDANGKWTGTEKVADHRHQRRSQVRRPPRSSRAKCSSWASSSTSGSCPRTRSTRSSLACPRQRWLSARTWVGSRTSPTRSRCWTPRSMARTSSSRATSTGRSSTSRRSTTR